jgi:hypothetical protein
MMASIFESFAFVVLYIMTIETRSRLCWRCKPERWTIGRGHTGDPFSTVIGAVASTAALDDFVVGTSSLPLQTKLPLRPATTPRRLRVRTLDRGSANSPRAGW